MAPPNRYKTPAERAGADRRTKTWREKQRIVGRRQRTFWLTNEEAEQVQQLIKELRGHIT